MSWLLAIVLAGSGDPLEVASYSDLTRPQLLEQRRILKEYTPPLVFPLLTTVGTPVPILIGASFLAVGLDHHPETDLAQTAVGACLLVAAVAEAVIGFLWLYRTVETRNAIFARVEEIEALLGIGEPTIPPAP